MKPLQPPGRESPGTRKGSPDAIPVLDDVVVPGQKAARGQVQPREERRASAVGGNELYAELFGDRAPAVDVEELVDRILGKHVEQLREELIEELNLLLNERDDGGD